MICIGVMPGLVPGMKVLGGDDKKAWMTGTSPDITENSVL